MAKGLNEIMNVKAFSTAPVSKFSITIRERGQGRERERFRFLLGSSKPQRFRYIGSNPQILNPSVLLTIPSSSRPHILLVSLNSSKS